MTDTELKSCIGTIEMLRRLHGVMNVIDAGNCEKIIKVLSDIPKYKDAYNKGWEDGAKATYEHLKMCEEEQSGDLISRDAVWDVMQELWGTSGELIDRLMALPSVNPQESKTGYCKECKYFEYDSVAKVDGIPLIVAHEICKRWGDGCKTKEDGYCFLYEPQESEVVNGEL